MIRELRNRMFEAVRHRINETIGVPENNQVDTDDYLYRPLTDKNMKRDLNSVTQDRMIDIAVFLYESTPLGKRLMELQKDYVIGEGIKYVAPDPRVKAVLDNHWYDPINNWDINQFTKAMELSLFGDQCWPVWVNPSDGAVKLGYIDPKMIKEVKRNPLNPIQLTAVETNASLSPVTGVDGDKKTEYKIIDYDRNPDSKTYGKLVGETFLFAVNRLSNGTRGRSDLLAISDWIDLHETFLFNMAERAKLITAFIWDVSFKGWSEKEIKAWVKENGMKAPNPGSVRYHNDGITWDAVTPKLEASDNSEQAKVIKNHIAAGAGIPPFWLAEGEETTRATALEMNSPTYKHFKARQFYFKYIMTFIFDFVIDQAIIHQTLPADVNRNFSIIMPPLAEKDFTQVATSMLQIASALQVAKDNAWITEKQAKDFFAHVSGLTGMEINPGDEDAPAKEPPAEEKKEDDVYNQEALNRLRGK